MFMGPILILGSPEAASIAEKLAVKHASMTTANVLVSDGLSNAIPTRVKIGPNFCVMELPNQQIVEVRANRVRFYDKIFNQVAETKPPSTLKIPDAAPSVAIIHRDALAWLVDSQQRKTFFNEIKRDPRWLLRPNSLVLVDIKRKSLSQVMYDNSLRVVEIKLSLNNKVISDWKYRYVSDQEVSMIPSSAKTVRGLSQRPALSAKSKGDAVLLAQKVWRSVSRLENRTITQTNDEGTFTLSVRPNLMSEKGPKGSWTLANSTLTITPNKGPQKIFSQKSAKFVDGIRASGMDVSPFAWYFLNRKLPYLDIFDGSDLIEVEGKGALNGKPVSILKIQRSPNRIRMYVDPDSGDLGMISSDSLDAKGNVVNSSRIRIIYR